MNAQLVAALRSAGGAYKKAASEGRAKDRNGYQTPGLEGARAAAAT